MENNGAVLAEIKSMSEKVASLDTKVCFIKDTVKSIDERQRGHDSLISEHCLILNDLRDWKKQYIDRLISARENRIKNGNKRTNSLWDIYNQYRGAVWIILLILGFLAGYFNIFKYF